MYSRYFHINFIRERVRVRTIDRVARYSFFSEIIYPLCRCFFFPFPLFIMSPTRLLRWPFKLSIPRNACIVSGFLPNNAFSAITDFNETITRPRDSGIRGMFATKHFTRKPLNPTRHTRNTISRFSFLFFQHADVL